MVDHLGPGHAEVTVAGESQEVAVLRSEGSCASLRVGRRSFTVRSVLVDGELLFTLDGHTHRVRDRSHQPVSRAEAARDGRLRAAMAGRVVAVHACEGEVVQAGQPLLTVEAMKIEHTHLAPINGTLAALLVTPDQQVTLRQVLADVVALAP